MADDTRVLESRRIYRCYVGCFGPHIVVSELPQLAFNSFCFCRFAWSTVNIAVTFLVNVTITFLVDVACCAPTLAVTGVRFGIYFCFQHLLPTKRDRWRLQIENGIIVAVVVIVVKGIELNRKSLDERYISGLDGLGSRLPDPVYL